MKGWSQAYACASDRNEQGKAEHHNPGRCPPPEPCHGRSRELPRRGVGRGEKAERIVGAEHNQAGEQGRESRGHKAAMGLEHSSQHHPDAVQRDLDRKHPQQGARQINLSGVGGSGSIQQQLHDGRGKQPGQSGNGSEHHHGPREQSRRAAVDVLTQVSGDGRCQQRDHCSGEGATGRHLEQHIGNRVRRRVRGAYLVGANPGVLSKPAPKANEPGRQSQDGDNRSGAGHPRTKVAKAALRHGVVGGACALSRPRLSSQVSAGWEAMIREKLTRSLTRVPATIVAKAPARTTRDGTNARLTPRAAPSAFAPVSPSMVDSPRSLGAAAMLAPITAVAADPPGPFTKASGIAATGARS